MSKFEAYSKIKFKTYGDQDENSRLIVSTAKEAFYYLKNNNNCSDFEREDKERLISLSPEYSVEYATIVGRFEKGEESISSSAKLSTYYAIHVLKNRFLKGEKEIAKSPYYSCAYSLFAMNGEKNDLIHRSMLEIGIREKNNYWVREYCRYMEHLKGEGEKPYWADRNAAINWF